MFSNLTLLSVFGKGLAVLEQPGLLEESFLGM
jgi:hypothetical protein